MAGSQTTPVTLNSFRGPSVLPRRSVVKGASLAAACPTQTSGHAARWMLKQVQHDEVKREAAE